MMETPLRKSSIPIWKPAGLTPFQVVELFKKKYREYLGPKVSYAGRLDPMAEGVLILLIGEENRKRKKYESLPKIYESEIIFGIATDTFDSLGIIHEIKLGSLPTEKEVLKTLKSFEGKQTQFYPPYSSKSVNGKPLYWWARQNKISEIEIPKKEIKIDKIELISYRTVRVSSLYQKVLKTIPAVRGDFRQEEVLSSWGDFNVRYNKEKVIKIKISVSCSSGTYIRRLASDLGGKLSCGAFALTIVRTKVGEYTKENCFELKFD